MFLHVSVILFTWGRVSAPACTTGHMTGGGLCLGGLYPGGVSVQGVSVGGVSVQGGVSVLGFRGVSVQGGSPGGSLSMGESGMHSCNIIFYCFDRSSLRWGQTMR